MIPENDPSRQHQCRYRHPALVVRHVYCLFRYHGQRTIQLVALGQPDFRQPYGSDRSNRGTVSAAQRWISSQPRRNATERLQRIAGQAYRFAGQA